MCGICGFVYGDGQRPAEQGTLSAMAHVLRFRGPDAEGYYKALGVGFGHRRLGVLDLEGGRQPMADPSGNVVLCYNGEIYNFLELREQLQADGFHFHTRCDTEVLLLGYLRWGEAVLDRLVGMFAFALWDRRSETLLLARDRLGVKPLYWTSLPDGGLAFGSELSAVTAHPAVPCRLHREAVARYITLGYVGSEQAILKDIRRLPPASLLIWRRGCSPQIRCYWDLADRWSNQPRDERPAAEIEEEFATLLRTAVRQRLISDVPLGAFLSGGLDSSSIAAVMRETSSRVKTFSIGFGEASYDELPWARRTASQLGCHHFDEVVRGHDPDLLLEISSKQDEPFADTSIIPTYVLCKMARQRVTVALSGDGGDELLAGYVTHRANRLHRRLRRLPRWLVRLARGTLALVPDSRRKVNVLFKAKQFLAGAEFSSCEAHAWWRMLLGRDRLSRLLGDHLPPDFDLFAPARSPYRQVRTLGRLDRFLYVDYKTWLVDDILVKADRASMAHGLEVRSPFLDHRLVEFCARLAPHWKLSRGKNKVLLRRFAQPLVPREVLKRRKAGFNAPVSHWLAGPWRDLAQSTLSAECLQETGILDSETVQILLGEHLRGRRDHGYLLFALLMLSLWVKRVKPSAG